MTNFMERQFKMADSVADPEDNSKWQTQWRTQ